MRERCRKSRIVIVTNGLSPQLIREKIGGLVEADERLVVRVSLDGPKKIHEKIRGVAGAYGKVLESINICKDAGVRDLGLDYTILDENIEYMNELYDFAREMGLSINYQVAHNSELYYKSDNKALSRINGLRDQLNQLIKKELSLIHPFHWFKAYYYSGLYNYALGGKSSRQTIETSTSKNLLKKCG